MRMINHESESLFVAKSAESLCLSQAPADVSSKYRPQLPCCWLGLSPGPGFGGKFRKFVSPVSSVSPDVCQLSGGGRGRETSQTQKPWFVLALSSKLSRYEGYWPAYGRSEFWWLDSLTNNVIVIEYLLQQVLTVTFRCCWFRWVIVWPVTLRQTLVKRGGNASAVSECREGGSHKLKLITD